MDLFEDYLNKKDTSKWVKRALTDSSYKNEYERINHKSFEGKDNFDLATYGDAVIRLCFCEIFLDKEEKLSECKATYESDKYLVEVVAEHYKLLKHIKKDEKNTIIANNYDYSRYKSNNGNAAKYIATAVEAMVGAIYIEEKKKLEPIVELLKTWMYFSKEKNDDFLKNGG